MTLATLTSYITDLNDILSSKISVYKDMGDEKTADAEEDYKYKVSDIRNRYSNDRDVMEKKLGEAKTDYENKLKSIMDEISSKISSLQKEMSDKIKSITTSTQNQLQGKTKQQASDDAAAKANTEKLSAMLK